MKPIVSIALLVVALLLACSTKTDPGTARTTSGVFDLTHAAGQLVPNDAVRSGSITFSPDQRFVDILEFRYLDAWIADTIVGDYIIRGDTVRFAVSGYGTYSAFYTTNTITFGQGANRWQYQRR